MAPSTGAKAKASTIDKLVGGKNIARILTSSFRFTIAFVILGSVAANSNSSSNVSIVEAYHFLLKLTRLTIYLNSFFGN